MLGMLHSHIRGDTVLCEVKRLPPPSYEVFEHTETSIPMAPSPSSTGASSGNGTTPIQSPHFGQSWYSCIVSVAGRVFETSFVYRAEENAKEKAAKKAFEALNAS